MTALTDEQIAIEKKFLEGVPRINVGALLLPAIWGPAHGMWVAVLYYPLWLFADNTFYAAWTQRSVLSLALAAIVLVTLVAGTVAFSIVAQPFAAHRAASRGVDRALYLKRERTWTIACVGVGCVMIAAATYYNLMVRPMMDVVA